MSLLPNPQKSRCKEPEEVDTSDSFETVQTVTAKLKSKKRNSGRGWLKRSVLTLSRSLMLLFLIILSSCAREDTIGAGKTMTESEYSEETSELYNLSRTREDAIGASKTITESEYSEEIGEPYNHLTTSNLIHDIVNHLLYRRAKATRPQ